MKKYKNNFTLIELLLVLAVMGILMGVGVSGLSKLNKGQAVNAAVRTISGQISLARSYAISQNRYTAFILPDRANSKIPGATSNCFHAKKGDSYIMQQSRLCYVTKDSSGIYNFDGWIEGQQWKKMPDGALALIAKKDARPPEPPDPVLTPDFTIVEDIGFMGDNKVYQTGARSLAIIFKPNGTVIGSQETTILIFFGIYPYKIASNRPGSPSTAKNEEYELTVNNLGEKKWNARWWQLSVNQFTGRTYFERINY
jgi:prepilin-type N-terminal cleavage/methylation domain-containing protein